MSDVDLLIRGDERDLAVADGRIVAVGPELGGPAREELDARGLLVLPGVVDAHVHLNEPGRTDWEGFATGTAALAAGGTTCAIDMPLNAVAADDRRRRLRRQGRGGDGRRARRRGAVGRPRPRRPRPPRRARDPWRRRLQGLHVGQRGARVRGRRRPDAAGGDGARGAPGPAGGRARRERGAHAPARAPGRRRGPARRARLPGLAAGRRRARGHRPRDRLRRRDGLRAARRPRLERPRRRARGAGAGARGRRHVRDVPALPGPRRRGRRAPRRGGQVRAAAARRRRARGPVGGAARRRRRPGGHRPLARAGGAQGGRRLLRGVGRDRGRPDAAGAALRRGRRGPRPRAGGAGRRCSPPAPARRFGLAPAKGALEVGADADVALVDPAATWTVAREELLDRHRLSPFVGRALRGRVVRTILRGRTIALDGRIVGEPCGRVVRRGA